LDWTTDGFFVEFGALDGILHSNTYLLENEFKWNGILVEPQKECHNLLRLNRNCKVDTRAVYSSSGKTLDFISTSLPGLSTLSTFHNESGKNSKLKSISNRYSVETISLNSLLTQHSAPREIDYISIDTEGSELEILRSFDFSEYEVKVWTIEHNFSPAREQIRKLMENHGYKRVFSDISQVDDWFICEYITLTIE
jgi:FkbM family methyltransferase